MISDVKGRDDSTLKTFYHCSVYFDYIFDNINDHSKVGPSKERTLGYMDCCHQGLPQLQ